MSSVLICGGGGFVGGHLAKRLIADGHRVRVADIKRVFVKGSIGEGRMQLLRATEFALAVMDELSRIESETDQANAMAGYHAGYQDGIVSYLMGKPYGHSVKVLEEKVNKGEWPVKDLMPLRSPSRDWPVDVPRVKTVTPALHVSGKKQNHPSTRTIN